MLELTFVVLGSVLRLNGSDLSFPDPILQQLLPNGMLEHTLESLFCDTHNRSLCDSDRPHRCPLALLFTNLQEVLCDPHLQYLYTTTILL